VLLGIATSISKNVHHLGFVQLEVVSVDLKLSSNLELPTLEGGLFLSISRGGLGNLVDLDELGDSALARR
jgi:hypothetical protein